MVIESLTLSCRDLNYGICRRSTGSPKVTTFLSAQAFDIFCCNGPQYDPDCSPNDSCHINITHISMKSACNKREIFKGPTQALTCAGGAAAAAKTSALLKSKHHTQHILLSVSMQPSARMSLETCIGQRDCPSQCTLQSTLHTAGYAEFGDVLDMGNGNLVLLGP